MLHHNPTISGSLSIESSNPITWNPSNSTIVFGSKVSSSVGFKGDGSELTGITVGFVDITGKPTLVSGSSQIDYNSIQNQPSIPTVGTATYIPYVNGGGTDFSYSSSLSFNGNTLSVTGGASTSNSTGTIVVTGGVGVSGDVNVGGDVVAYASSDKRFKKNIKRIPDPISKVTKLNGVTWEWDTETTSKTTQSSSAIGVIAQEVEEVLPELVHMRDDGYLSVDYPKIVGLLIESIKEQQSQIDELIDKINKLNQS